MEKLEPEQIHILRLIKRDADDEGWTPVSDALYNVLPSVMPEALVIFEQTENGARARLTQEGSNFLSALKWL